MVFASGFGSGNKLIQTFTGQFNSYNKFAINLVKIIFSFFTVKTDTSLHKDEFASSFVSLSTTVNFQLDFCNGQLHIRNPICMKYYGKCRHPERWSISCAANSRKSSKRCLFIVLWENSLWRFHTGALWEGIPHCGSRTSAFRHLRSKCGQGLQTFIVVFLPAY